MSLRDADLSELSDRFNYLVDNYVDLAKKLSVMLDDFGRKRTELQLISAEFLKRGVVVQVSEDLQQSILKEIEKERNE